MTLEKNICAFPKIRRGLEKWESTEGPTGANKSLGHHYLTACCLHILWKYISTWCGWWRWVTTCCKGGSWRRQGIIPLYSLDHIAYWVQFWAPWYTGKAPVNGNKFSRGPARWLGHLSHEDVLRELGLFGLEKRWLWGHLTATHHLEGSHHDVSWGPFPPPHVPPRLNDSTSQNSSIFVNSKQGETQSSSVERYLVMFKEIAYIDTTSGKSPASTLYPVNIWGYGTRPVQCLGHISQWMLSLNFFYVADEKMFPLQ